MAKFLAWASALPIRKLKNVQRKRAMRSAAGRMLFSCKRSKHCGKAGTPSLSYFCSGRNLVDLELEFAFDKAFDACHHPFTRLLTFHQNDKVSSLGESHPQALLEPGVNLSAHRTPIIQPTAKSPSANGRTAAVRDVRSDPTNVLPDADGN